MGFGGLGFGGVWQFKAKGSFGAWDSVLTGFRFGRLFGFSLVFKSKDSDSSRMWVSLVSWTLKLTRRSKLRVKIILVYAHRTMASMFQGVGIEARARDFGLQAV